MSREKKVDTILTRREYRVRILATAGIASRDGSARLEKIASALRSPCYTPYLGRMSCPFGLPFYPIISEAACVRDAFRNFDEAKTDEIRAFEKEFDLVGKPFLISADTDLALDGRTRVDLRRDVLTSGRRRQFATRSEDVAVFAPEEPRRGSRHD
jgi:CRISPR system Cascade subunit CasD